MAGIHLPDIGKLGIHVATGIRDKKKVAPMNMAEEARLKAFLNRVETERNERSRVMKKELRRMKRRKKRIDKRLEDIELSKNIPLHIEGKSFQTTGNATHLPSILTTSVAKKSQKSSPLKNHTQEDVTLKGDYVKESVSKITIFPIQDELDTTNSEKLFPSLTPQMTQEKVCNETRKAENLPKKASNETEMTEDTFTKQTKRKSLALNNVEDKISDVPCTNDSRGSVSFPLDTIVFLPQLQPIEIFRRKEPQKSLEDAFKAIKTCRYIRTPSRRTSIDNEQNESNFEDANI